MAQCKYCGKTGFFLWVSERGLCKTCDPIVLTAISRHMQIIMESLDIAQDTKKFETKINRLDTAAENVLILENEYGSKGIPLGGLNTHEMIQSIEGYKNAAIEEEVFTRVEKSMDKARLASTLSSKINNANKALLILKEFKDEYSYDNAEMERYIDSFIHKSHLEDYIKKAEKEEFKGNHKKAIDQYLEALFFLNNDGINNEEQQEIIKELEQKIASLREKMG